MFRACFLGIIAALMAASQPPPQRPSLGIFLNFDSELPTVSLAAMKAEVAKIMRPTGFALYWRLLVDNQGTEAFSHIAVVQFHGKCQLSNPAVPVTPKGEYGLAATLVRDGSVLPYSDIACDKVARILPSGVGDRQIALGRLLGRIVAHEIYHSVANVTQHAASGIAKGTHSATDLAAGSLMFDDASTRIIRRPILQ